MAIINLFDQDGSPIICPGDLLDKKIILKLKLTKDNNNPVVLLELSKVDYLLKCLLEEFINNLDLYIEYKKLEEILIKINTKQWECEDRIRTEKSWEAAYQARIHNSERVKTKNQINQLFNYPVEVKYYQGDKDVR